MTVSDAMTPCPLTVTPRTTVATALRLIRDNGISHLPVVERGRVVGVVRESRLLVLTPSEATTLSRHEATELLSRLTVERAVEPAMVVVGDTLLAEAGRTLLREHADEALVIEQGRLCGILTRSDLLRGLIAQLDAESPALCGADR